MPSEFYHETNLIPEGQREIHEQIHFGCSSSEVKPDGMLEDYSGQLNGHGPHVDIQKGQEICVFCS